MRKNNILKRIGAFALAMSMVLSCGVVNAADEDTTAKNPSVVDTTKDVKFTIHKYEMESLDGVVTPGDGTEMKDSKLPEKAKPLSGVTFKLFKVAEDEVETTIPYGASAVDTVTTDDKGLAVFKIAAKDQGRYLVVETDYPDKVYTPCENFLVDLPMMNPEGTDWNYDVHAYPKNVTVVGAVQLTKVDKDDNTKLEGAVFKLQKKSGDEFVDVLGEDSKVRTFTTDAEGIISVSGLVHGDYQFIETAPPAGYGINTTPIAFTIDKNGNIDKSGNKTGTVVSKTAYDVKTPTVEKEVNNDSVDVYDIVTWTITPTVPSDIESYQKYIVTDTLDSRLGYEEGSLTVMLDGEAITDGFTSSVTGGNVNVTFTDFAKLDGKVLTIEFKTKVLEGVLENPGYIDNKAKVEFKNQFGTDGSTESDNANVYVGNICVRKFDKNDESRVLPGAQFALYKTKEDAIAGTNQLGDVVTTNAKGEAYFKGYKAGDYWLVEKQAPTFKENDNSITRYLLMKEPKLVTITKGDPNGTVTVGVENRAEGFTIPKTGGTGTMIFLFAGLLLVSGATIVLVLRKRKFAGEA